MMINIFKVQNNILSQFLLGRLVIIYLQTHTRKIIRT